MTADRLPAPTPWYEIDWTAHQRTVRLAGTEINCVDLGQGPPVLLIHGLGGCWQTWLENLGALSAHHRVLAVDLPGFGSSPELAAPLELERLVAVIAELLAALELAETSVVGHSLGGLIGLALAEQRPDLVSSLVLLSGGGVALGRARMAALMRSFRMLDAVLSRPQVPQRIARTPALRWAMVRVAVKRPGKLSEQLALQIIPPMNAPGFAATATAGAHFLRTRAVPAPSCRTLLLWGRFDRVLPLRTAREFARSLPDAELAVVDGAGHCAMFERPDVVNAILLAFLRGERPSGLHGRISTREGGP